MTVCLNYLRLLRAAALAAVLSSAGSAMAQLPFFPGAEGHGGTFFGSAPAGGWFSNATIYHVTNLNDSGAGSFRGAFAENSTNKIIVFDVGGTITLTDSLDIKNLTNYYIAGQTAPSPVTITGDTTQITHSNNKVQNNVILRYMTFRKGTGNGADAITFAGGGANGIANNMIIDHVSATWSEDEVLSVTNYNTNVTVQYSMMTDSLTSGHEYGSLIRPKNDAQVSFHHNLYGNDKSRNPRAGTYDNKVLDLDFRNNVIYNWSDRAGYTGGASESETEYVNMNYVGNYAIAGPATPLGVKSTTAFTMDVSSFFNLATHTVISSPKDYIALQIYQSGNVVDSDHDAVRDGVDSGWDAFRASAGTVSEAYPDFNYGPNSALPAKRATPFAYPAVTTQTADAAYNQVLNYVGNSWWARDVIDTRIIGNVVNNTQPAGGVPATAPVPSELAAVNGAPLVSRTMTTWDTDLDGMPNAWELAHGLNPNSAADNKLDFDSDGYINVVEYLNEAGEIPCPAPIVFNGSASTRYAQIMNWKTSDGVTAGSNWQPSKHDLAVVNSGTVTVDAVGQHAGILSIAPTAGNTATLNITGGWLDVQYDVQVGAGGSATVNHSGGLLLTDVVTLGGASGASGVYNLSGSGVLRTEVLRKGANGGAFHMTGGTLSAEEVQFSLVNQGGVIAPGNSPGETKILGDLTLDSGVLEIEIGGRNPNQYDRVVVTGQATLGGTLKVTLVNLGGGAITPGLGDSFPFLFSNGVFESFDAYDLPPLDPSLAWRILSYNPTTVLAVVPSNRNPADFNYDGRVDGDDLTEWKSGFSSLNQPDYTTGDSNGDHAVDGADFLSWQQNFGTGPPAVEAMAAVPEPASWTLVGGCAWGASRRRRRSSRRAR